MIEKLLVKYPEAFPDDRGTVLLTAARGANIRGGLGAARTGAVPRKGSMVFSTSFLIVGVGHHSLDARGRGLSPSSPSASSFWRSAKSP